MNPDYFILRHKLNNESSKHQVHSNKFTYIHRKLPVPNEL